MRIKEEEKELERKQVIWEHGRVIGGCRCEMKGSEEKVNKQFSHERCG